VFGGLSGEMSMRSGGKASARFAKPIRVRAVLRWTVDELAIVKNAIDQKLSLDQTHALLPHRTRDGVKDQYYRARPLESREVIPRERPAAVEEASHKNDCIRGSAALLEALMNAGLVFRPVVK
jgi:hypothetical protein